MRRRLPSPRRAPLRVGSTAGTADPRLALRLGANRQLPVVDLDRDLLTEIETGVSQPYSFHWSPFGGTPSRKFRYLVLVAVAVGDGTAAEDLSRRDGGVRRRPRPNLDTEPPNPKEPLASARVGDMIA